MREAISFLIAIDPVLQKVHQQFGDPFVPSRPEGFQTLCKLILEQQVSLESAKACYQKMELFLKKVCPETVSEVTPEELRNCGVSRQKAVYLKSLAEAVLQKLLVLETLSSKSSETVRGELIQIKGIGNWTIDVYLMFALQSPDILPMGDIAVVTTIKELYGCEDQEAMIAVTERWKPFRSMGTYFLWHYYLEKRNRKPIF